MKRWQRELSIITKRLSRPSYGTISLGGQLMYRQFYLEPKSMFRVTDHMGEFFVISDDVFTALASEVCGWVAPTLLDSEWIAKKRNAKTRRTSIRYWMGTRELNRSGFTGW